MENNKFINVARNLYIRNSVYYFRIYTNGSRKWISLKSTVKSEAIKEKDQLLAQKKLGILPSVKNDIKLTDMLKEYVKWIETSPDAGLRHKEGMSPTLIEEKKFNLNIILDYFPNGIKINDSNINRYFGLALEDIRKRPGTKGNKYISESTIHSYRVTLSGAFTWAMKEGPYDIKYNPVTSTKKVKSLNKIDPYKSKHHELWERSEFEAALREYKDNKYVPETWYPLIALGGYGGMRIGEIVALKWSDYDEQNNEIKIDKNRRSAGVGKGFEETTPKSMRGFRKFPVCPELKTILKEHKENQYSLSLKSGQIFSDDFPIIYNTTKKLKNIKSTTSVCRKTIYKLRDKGIIPETYTFHGLRHHFGSYWYSKGVPMNIIAEWMGDDVETLRKVYINVLKEQSQSYAEKIIRGEI